MGAGERVICSIGAAGVTAEAVALLAFLTILSSQGHRMDCLRNDTIRNRGGIVSNISQMQLHHYCPNAAIDQELEVYRADRWGDIF